MSILNLVKTEKHFEIIRKNKTDFQENYKILNNRQKVFIYCVLLNRSLEILKEIFPFKETKNNNAVRQNLIRFNVLISNNMSVDELDANNDEDLFLLTCFIIEDNLKIRKKFLLKRIWLKVCDFFDNL